MTRRGPVGGKATRKAFAVASLMDSGYASVGQSVKYFMPDGRTAMTQVRVCPEPVKLAQGPCSSSGTMISRFSPSALTCQNWVQWGVAAPGLVPPEWPALPSAFRVVVAADSIHAWP